MYINNLGHMTKMAAMPIYGKNPSNIFFSETNRLISMKLGVKHPWLKYYNVYINHDSVITLTKFMVRSTWIAHAFEWVKVLKCHLKGKASKKLANGQNIDYSEKRKRPKGFICPCSYGINVLSNNVNVILAFLHHFLLNSPNFGIFAVISCYFYLMKGVIPKHVIERKLLC